jgi:hypothetical protein
MTQRNILEDPKIQFQEHCLAIIFRSSKQNQLEQFVAGGEYAITGNFFSHTFMAAI